MGNERAVLAARGVKLAPRGSVRDEALREIVRRERNEKFAEVQLFAKLLGQGLGLPDEQVGRMLDLYLLELSQDRYQPSIVAALRAVRVARVQKAAHDKTMLEKVARMDYREGELPDPKKKKRRRRRR